MYRAFCRALRRAADSARSAAAMLQVTDWLEKLGLGHYAERFAEDDISFWLLSVLAGQALKEVEVSSLRHRRERLRAIATFHKPSRGPLRHAREWRHVTV